MIRKTIVIACSSLFVVTVALWCTSWAWSLEADILRSASGRGVTIDNYRGRINVTIARWNPNWPQMARVRIEAETDVKKRLGWSDETFASLAEQPQFSCYTIHGNWSGSAWTGYDFAFPHWLPVLLFAAYPVLAFIRGPYRRYRRRKKGLCLKCGYNLEGNVSGVCPECGERI